MSRKVLFIGGTGTISNAITRLVAADPAWELWLLNRGNRNAELPQGVHTLQGDIHDEAAVAGLIRGMQFDVVADFIAYGEDDLARDYRLFAGKTRQFFYISSASAYQKPASNWLMTESTPLYNPYWDYSRGKIEGEEYLMRQYRETGFPVTIVRPSHTYDERKVPLSFTSSVGCWPVLKRMLEGKPVVIPGDGTSLWTLTHNSDFAKGFVGLMGNLHAIGEALHITSDEVLTWNQVYQTVAGLLGVELNALHLSSDFINACYPGGYPGLPGDKAHCAVFDNTKLKRLVPGFTATVRFDQGIAQTVEYILSHPETQKEDPDFDSWCDRAAAAQQLAQDAMR